MKPFFFQVVMLLLLTNVLHAQRQETAPMGNSVIIRDLEANKRADGLALTDQNVQLTENFQRREFAFTGTAGSPVTIAFRAYPNPVVDHLRLEVAGPELDFYVTLYNQSGQALGLVNRNVAGTGLWEENFNLTSLPVGTYMLVFSDAAGRRLAAQQIVKQY
jgi:hypothetical protein